MQVAWPGAREGIASSMRMGIPLWECLSRVDWISPAFTHCGTNHVPEYQEQVRLSSPAPGSGNPVDGSGVGTAVSVHQSCYRNGLPFFLATLQVLCGAGIAAFCPSLTPERAGLPEHPECSFFVAAGTNGPSIWSVGTICFEYRCLLSRSAAKLRMVLLTCKKNIDTFWSANEMPFAFQKKKKKQQDSANK